MSYTQKGKVKEIIAIAEEIKEEVKYNIENGTDKKIILKDIKFIKEQTGVVIRYCEGKKPPFGYEKLCFKAAEIYSEAEKLENELNEKTNEIKYQ